MSREVEGGWGVRGEAQGVRGGTCCRKPTWSNLKEIGRGLSKAREGEGEQGARGQHIVLRRIAKE